MDEFRDVLPDEVQPKHYSLALSNLCLQAPWTYTGQVDIELEVRRATRIVVLNSHELKVEHAQVLLQHDSESGPTIYRSTKISHDAGSQRCFVHFDLELEAAAHKVVLSLCFEGYMNDYMAGFYRSEYTASSGELMHTFSTQFEPSEARRAFPCFDEPALKTTFDMEIEVPADMIALSNMPVKASRPSLGGDGGRKTIIFERTPRMSTYLLSWAIGHFEFSEKTLTRKHRSEPLPIRVYTTEGLGQHAKRGLEVACDVIDYFSDMFDIEYPLPKLDLIAIHEMSDDAMENWGLVTFRPTALLYNEIESDPSYISYMTYIIAHELAHQWFGNITTMVWWDELWLNEGFATWAGWCACDHLHPEWQVWATFAADDMRTAFDLDGLHSSHPIQVPIPDGREVDSIFDSISYLKSASVIRMLAERLGLPNFLKGVSNYLRANAYQNATAEALWNALEKESEQRVTSVMASWVKEVGLPVLTVSDVTPNSFRIRQERFLFSGEKSPENSTTVWWIPVQVPSQTGTQRIDLKSRESVIQKPDTLGFHRLNAGQMGFYLTQLPADELERLYESIQEASKEDQVGLLTDVATLALSENSTTNTAAVLSVVSCLTTATPVYSVLSLIMFCLERVQSIFSDDRNVSRAVDELIQDVVGPAAQELSWTVHPDDDHLKIKTRALVLCTAGLAGHSRTVCEALRRWDRFRENQDAKAIHPSLRGAVFSIAMQCRGVEALETLQEEYMRNPTPDIREVIVEAMGEVATPDLANTCLKSAFSGGLASSDASDLLINLAKNTEARETVWNFMRDNWTVIDERLGGSSAVMEPLIRNTMQVFGTLERRAEIESFFRDKDTTGYTRGLTIALERISINAAYRERDTNVVRGWLKEKGYL